MRGSRMPAASRIRSSTPTRSIRRKPSRTVASASGLRWRTARIASVRTIAEETRLALVPARNARKARDPASSMMTLTKAELSR